MPSTSPTNRFNPGSEDGTVRQVAAGNWELLRRVPAFQAVAQQWIANQAFRFEQVSEKKGVPGQPAGKVRARLDAYAKAAVRLGTIPEASPSFFRGPCGELRSDSGANTT